MPGSPERLETITELRQAVRAVERDRPVRERPELKLISGNECLECARLEATITQIAESYERHIAELQGINTELTNELGKKLREISRLKTEKRKDLEKSKDFPTAKKVFRYWVEITGRSSACVFGEDRVERVLWALSKYEPRYICEAIKGYAMDPYVDPKGKRHDELTLILRSSAKVEDGHDRYERWRQRVQAA